LPQKRGRRARAQLLLAALRLVLRTFRSRHGVHRNTTETVVSCAIFAADVVKPDPEGKLSRGGFVRHQSHRVGAHRLHGWHSYLLHARALNYSAQHALYLLTPDDVVYDGIFSVLALFLLPAVPALPRVLSYLHLTITSPLRGTGSPLRTTHRRTRCLILHAWPVALTMTRLDRWLHRAFLGLRPSGCLLVFVFIGVHGRQNLTVVRVPSAPERRG